MKLMRFMKEWLKVNRGTVKFVLLTFILWQVAIAAIIFLAERVAPTTYQYLYTEQERIVNPRFLWGRANFDGIHYLDIARKGYGIYQQAFFPFYPWLIKRLTPIFLGKDLLAAWGISVLSLLASLFFLYKLVKLDYQESICRRTLIYLLIFPTAFFFSAVYTESLFLFLVLASFYFARTKKWWLAGILGGLASATRLVGIFLLPALLVEWWQPGSAFNRGPTTQKRKVTIQRSMVDLVPLFLVPLGLIAYIRFLDVNYRDPLMFFHVQPFFGGERTGGKIILLYQVFWRYFKMLITVDKDTPTYFVCLLEFFSGAGFLILTIFAYLRRWFSYTTFMALAYVAPTLTGTFSSLPRYSLVLFPGFILLAIWGEKYRLIGILYPLIAVPLLIVSLLFFSQGHWVA